MGVTATVGGTAAAAAAQSPPPVELQGLVKRFRNGVTAVAGLDLVVGHGEVWGLLGLNGAGKTTTLRMLVGLVRPSAGRVLVFGEPVVPGAPVLHRVGALVDAPGFAPHLSGRRNLELYWEAGGGPAPGAGVAPGDPVARALAVAGLEEAAERPVRGYSFGMRQRLGLARALIGRPPLVVLDEPTTGLDPRQVREVRALVRSLAGHGTTVLLSSHLLAEVEQICTHAAVIDRGRLVTAGTVDELTGAATTVYLEVDDVERAMAVLGASPGVVGMRLDGRGIAVELAGLRRSQLVALLVRAGIGVETVGSRHRLEEAFLGMLQKAEP